MSAYIANNSMTFVSGVYNPPSMMIANMPKQCKFVHTTIPADWMKYVIGNNGYYFNAITYQSGCSYIWFHKEINMIEIWGVSMQNLQNAETRLLERMEYICIEVLTRNGMMKDGKNVMKKVSWADIYDDEDE